MRKSPKKAALLDDQDREFVKPTTISRHLVCAVCYKVFRNPLRLSCGHTLCSGCLTGMSSCPLCRRPIPKERPPEKDFIAHSIIDDLEVYCINKKNMCSWAGPVSELQSHFSSCAFDETPKWLQQRLKEKMENKLEFNFEFHGDEMDHEKERMNGIGANQSLMERCYSNTINRTTMKNVLDSSAKKSQKKGNGRRTNQFLRSGSLKGLGDVSPGALDREELLNALLRLGESDSEERKEMEKPDEETNENAEKEEALLFESGSLSEIIRRKEPIKRPKSGIVGQIKKKGSNTKRVGESFQ